MEVIERLNLNRPAFRGGQITIDERQQTAIHSRPRAANAPLSFRDMASPLAQPAPYFPIGFRFPEQRFADSGKFPQITDVHLYRNPYWLSVFSCR